MWTNIFIIQAFLKLSILEGYYSFIKIIIFILLFFHISTITVIFAGILESCLVSLADYLYCAVS